jgi:glutaredoxin 3
MDKKARVRVYSAPRCPWCQRAKDFLNEHGIEFEDVNVLDDKEAGKEIADRTGQLGIPVIEIGNELVVGFDRDMLVKLLGIRE